MNQHERDLYRAICTADPDCKCGLICDTPGCACALSIHMPIAQAAIENHLHTRLVRADRLPSRVSGYGDDEWIASSWNVTRIDYRGPSKLRALLVAHAVRLGLPVPKEITE